MFDRLTGAAADLRTAIDGEFHAALALDKAAVTSNDDQLCKDLRDALGDAGGQPTVISQFLGVDTLHGRRRRLLHKGSKWQKRSRAATARKRRLSRLKSAKCRGATRIYTTGIQPAATWGRGRRCG